MANQGQDTHLKVSEGSMEEQLSLEFLRVVENGAIAAARTMGFGDRHKADEVAVEAMRKTMAWPRTRPKRCFRKSTLPSIRWRAPICARRELRAPSRCLPPAKKAGCC